MPFGAGRLKFGTPEGDAAAYEEWGQAHASECRKRAAEASILLCWGMPWGIGNPKLGFSVTGYMERADRRLTAFAGEEALEVVFNEWRVSDWADVDHGSVLMMLMARDRIKSAFAPSDSPSGGRFWSNIVSLAKAALMESRLDGDIRGIIPDNALSRVAPIDTMHGKVVHSLRAGETRAISGGNP
jgi:hypothetical protein